jgi:hypothetical protein
MSSAAEATKARRRLPAQSPLSARIARPQLPNRIFESQTRAPSRIKGGTAGFLKLL